MFKYHLDATPNLEILYRPALHFNSDDRAAQVAQAPMLTVADIDISLLLCTGCANWSNINSHSTLHCFLIISRLQQLGGKTATPSQASICLLRIGIFSCAATL